MKHCDTCGRAIDEGEERKHQSKTVCEDCYIDTLLPPVRKTYYENDSSEFMRRLRDAYTSIPQRYH